MKSAGTCGQPDFLIRAMAVDDDLRTIVELQFQYCAVEAALDVRLTVVDALLDTIEYCIGQFVEFAFRHIILLSTR